MAAGVAAAAAVAVACLCAVAAVVALAPWGGGGGEGAAAAAGEVEIGVARELGDRFGVPERIVRAMGGRGEDVLGELVGKDGERGRLLVLGAGGRREGRLRAIAGGLGYAKGSGRVLVVLWELDGEGMVEPMAGGCGVGVVVVGVRGVGKVLDGLAGWEALGLTVVGEGEGEVLDDVVALDGKHVVVKGGGEDLFEGRRYGGEWMGGWLYGECVALPRDGEGDGDGTWNGLGLAVQRRFPWVTARLGRRRGYELAAARLRVAEEVALAGRVLRGVAEEEVEVELHDKFHVPWVFLQAMEAGVKGRFLLKLRESASGRALVLHTQYGLGNRLRALGSAMALAEEAGMVLVVVWVPDVHLACRFGDLFVNQDLLVVDRMEGLKWPPGEIRPRDAALSKVDFWNMMKGDGAGGSPVHNAIKVNVNPREGRHLYVKSAYVIKSSLTVGILAVTSDHWKVLRDSLAPVLPVATLVDDPALAHVASYVGVHIRGRTLANDIAGVGRSSYGNISADTTDKWRRLTGVATFAAKIRLLKPSYKFFVAADRPEAIEALVDEFGEARILSLRQTEACEDRSVRCAQLALADLLVLARVRVLLGSHWSSFTESAVRLNPRISAKRIFLAGVHFGRGGARDATAAAGMEGARGGRATSYKAIGHAIAAVRDVQDGDKQR